MEKLVRMHLPHSKYWDCYNDVPLEENHALHNANITAETAIGFAEWIEDSFIYKPIAEKCYYDRSGNLLAIDASELFTIYINQL
jgi:hypothetical protein